MRYKPLPPLKELKEFLHYNPDTGTFTWIKKPSQATKVGQKAGHLHKGTGYIRIKFKDALYYANRLAYYMYHGVDPLENLVDHKNDPKSNNKIDNLRLANGSQNQMHRINLASDNTSGTTGVNWDKINKRWQVFISVNGKRKHIGSFINKEDAIKTRREAEIKYYGEFRGNV
jgi:hypothetical protein